MFERPRPSPVKDPAQDASDLILRLGVFVLAVAMPCAAVFSRRAIFSLTPIGAILALIAIGLTAHRGEGRRLLPVLASPLFLALVFLLFWAGLSLIWTPFPASASERYLRTVGTVGVIALSGIFAPTRTKTSNLYLLPVGVALAGAATVFMALYDRVDLVEEGVSLDASTLARASAGVLMLTWPALAGLAVRERWRSAVAIACVAAAAVFLVGSPFVIAALALGAAVFALSLPFARPVGLAGAILTAALFAFAPLLALLGGAVHVGGLLSGAPELSEFVRSEGLRLVAGHGLGSAGQAALAGRAPALTLRSGVLEIWYELGLWGGLSAALASASAFYVAAKAQAPLSSFSFAALASGFVLTIFDLAPSQLWWLTLASAACFFFVLAKRGRYRTERPHVALVNGGLRPQPPLT